MSLERGRRRAGRALPALGLVLLLLAPAATRATAPDCPSPIATVLAPARHLVVVTTPVWTATPAMLRRYVRAAADQPWRADGAAVPAVVGRKGMAWGHDFRGLRHVGEPLKAEGDGRSPAGVFRLGRRFGLEPGSGADFLRLDDSTLCIDDPRSRHYNRIVDGRRVARDWRSAERMGAIRYYRRGLEVLYPSSADRRAGSCIFIHEWEGAGQGTAGCVAAAPPVLEELHRLEPNPARPPVLVMLPEPRLRALGACWPELTAEPRQAAAPSPTHPTPEAFP